MVGKNPRIITPSASSESQRFQEPRDMKGRILGLSLIMIQISFMISYGMSGSFYIENTSTFIDD